MVEREVLLLSLNALLLVALLRELGPVARRAGTRGLQLAAMGALLPLGDLLWALVTAPDRLAILARNPVLETPLGSLAALALLAVLSGFARTPRRGLAVLSWGAVGWALFWLLALLCLPGVQPAPALTGVPQVRVGLPLVVAGHPLLAVLLAALLLALEGARRLDAATAVTVLRHGAVWGLALYVAWAGGSYAWVHDRARQEGGPAQAQLFPTSVWGTAWGAVQTLPSQLRVRQIRWGDAAFSAEETVERWDSQPLLLKFLGDPLVQRYYFRVYRHPVAHVETRGARVRLFLAEWGAADGPQRSLMVEATQQGGGRIYELEGFR